MRDDRDAGAFFFRSIPPGTLEGMYAALDEQAIAEETDDSFIFNMVDCL
jgi:hypothetical protein